MVDASQWVGIGGTTAASDRAEDALRRIDEKPTSIVIVRRIANVNTSLAAQTVRVEYSTQQSTPEDKGGAGMSSTQRAIVFGLSGHDSEPDTDIERDDRFTLNGRMFRVVSVIFQTGEIQANCEVQT